MKKIIGYFLQLIFPSYSFCGKCGWTWNIVEGHCVRYSKTESMFALCEDCWNKTDTQERIRYYLTVWNKWKIECIANGWEQHPVSEWYTLRRNIINSQKTS